MFRILITCKIFLPFFFAEGAIVQQPLSITVSNETIIGKNVKVLLSWKPPQGESDKFVYLHLYYFAFKKSLYKKCYT